MPDCFDRLTLRQKNCLRLVREGFTTKEIAARIGASPAAVEKVVKLAMARMGASNRREAARMLADHEARCGVRASDSPSPDLHSDATSGEKSPSPPHGATPPTVGEDRAAFVPHLGSAPKPPLSENRRASKGTELRETVNRVLERVFQIAGVLLMVLALAGLLSVAYHRWEQAHHIRPR